MLVRARLTTSEHLCPRCAISIILREVTWPAGCPPHRQLPPQPEGDTPPRGGRLSSSQQHIHTLPCPDDPAAGGPGPACGSEEADGPETGGSAAGVPASVGGPAFSPGLCFFGGGPLACDEDELSDEEEDELI